MYYIIETAFLPNVIMWFQRKMECHHEMFWEHPETLFAGARCIASACRRVHHWCITISPLNVLTCSNEWENVWISTLNTNAKYMSGSLYSLFHPAEHCKIKHGFQHTNTELKWLPRNWPSQHMTYRPHFLKLSVNKQVMTLTRWQHWASIRSIPESWH